MVMNGPFHALASVPWGKATICLQCRRLDGPQGQSGYFGQGPNVLQLPESNPRHFCTNTINTVLLFIINFIAYFKFNDLECEMLNINDERYTMYEAKESALKWRSQDRKLIWKDKINSPYCDLKY